MSFLEDSSHPPEDRWKYVEPVVLSKLTTFQLRWLDTQARALENSSTEILNGVLSEWFGRRPATKNGGVISIETVRAALDDFITSHHAEFLPVDFSE